MTSNLAKNYVFVSLTKRQFSQLLPSMERSIAELTELGQGNKKESAFYKSAAGNFTKALTILKAARPDLDWPDDKAERIRLSHEHYFMAKDAAQGTIDALQKAFDANEMDAVGFAARMVDAKALLAELEGVNPRAKSTTASSQPEGATAPG